MFVGRRRELHKFNQMYQSGQFEFAVVYGRRRVGKTTLINQFCKDKKNIYFIGLESTEKENLESLSKAVYNCTNPDTSLPSFDSFPQLLDYILHISTQERLILVIDEYPYLAAAKPAISSMLQAFIDQKLKDSKLFLILCGSSMSFMEEQVLGYKSPLYGRRTAQFKVEPFTYFEATEMLPSFSEENQAILYGVSGGIPEYLARIKPTLNLKENLVQLFFDPAGRLFEEPANLLKQELRDPSTYNAVISAIASGASRLNQIAQKVGIENSHASNLLNSLISLGIVKKEQPVTENAGRKSIYLLEDQMFRFWYRFVNPNMSQILGGYGEAVYDHQASSRLNEFMEQVFERICQEYLTRFLEPDQLPFFYSRIGRWWGNNPILKREEEIDILAFNDQKAIFGECKWTNSVVSLEVLNSLQARAQLFHFEDVYFYLFSKSGFTDSLKDLQHSQSNIRLISYHDMLSSTSNSQVDTKN